MCYNGVMDGQEYLDQISASVRPEKKSRMSGLFSSPILKVVGIGVILLIIIMIFGGILSGGRGGVERQTTELLYNVRGTTEILNSYQWLTKSSDLRSNSVSLNSVLSLTSSELTGYLTEQYNYSEKNVSKDIVEEANLHRDEVLSALFEAKITGVLDRIYAHKIAYEISSIMTREASLYEIATDETLLNILGTSYNSLNNLYDKFNDFSETK